MDVVFRGTERLAKRYPRVHLKLQRTIAVLVIGIQYSGIPISSLAEGEIVDPHILCVLLVADHYGRKTEECGEYHPNYVVFDKPIC